MNCLDCQFHKRVNDKDPDDWFNSDDEAVLCTKIPIPAKPNSRLRWEWHGFRAVTTMARPYQTRRESETPQWCPLGLAAPAVSQSEPESK